MSDYPTHYRLIRAIGAVLVLVPALFIVLFFNDDPGETRTVKATVIESHSTDGSGGSLPVVLVRLDSGEEVRLYAGSRALSPGQAVMLMETRYDEGDRRFRLLSDRERLTDD